MSDPETPEGALKHLEARRLLAAGVLPRTVIERLGPGVQDYVSWAVFGPDVVGGETEEELAEIYATMIEHGVAPEAAAANIAWRRGAGPDPYVDEEGAAEP